MTRESLWSQCKHTVRVGENKNNQIVYAPQGDKSCER